MPPPRFRKRNSTVQALDLLNNVGTANQHQPTPRSRVQQQPRRQLLRAEVQIPQSDDIWDIPNSPEKRPDTRQRVADSEPITPRRSARYRPQVEQDKEDDASRSGNRWLRSRAAVDYTKGTQGIEEENDQDGSEGEEGDLRLFSEDDTPKTARSSRRTLQKPSDKDEFPDLPSPSVLFRGEGFVLSPNTSEQSGSGSEESDPDEEVPDAPRTTQKSDTNKTQPETTRKPDTNKTQNEKESGSSEEESGEEESGESGDESSSREAPRPRPIVQINQARTSSQQSASRRESRNIPATQTRKTPAQPQANKDSGQRKDASTNPNVEEDSGSSYETDDGESDSRSSSEEPARRAPDEDDLAVPRQSKRRRVEPEPSTRRQSLRNQRAAPALGGQEVRDTRGQSPESDGEEDDDSDEEEEDEEDEAAKEAEKTKKFQWMEEAMGLGQQRNNWLVLTGEAGELKRMADPSLAEYFVDVCTAIRELRKIYADMLDTPPSSTDLARCNNLLESIPREGDELLDQAYYMATRDSNFSEREEHARELVAEFEARVIPDMVRLLVACFHVYYTNPVTFPGLHGHFRRVLLLLLRFYDRTTSMKAQRIVRGVIRTKGLRRALHELLQGLDSWALRPKRASVKISGAGNQREDIMFVDGHEREWSEDEGLALIDGLQAYQGKWKRDDPSAPCHVLTLHPGPDRYLHIFEHLGHRLRHRTQRELRAKALEVHDRMQPTIAAQLETEEGRGRWGWLLSVRGSYRLH